jgi:antitoxin (DNA-binding transcriptional repressor) of toxin-antitoxin stability system
VIHGIRPIHKAKTTFLQILARVERGEEIVRTRGNQPTVKLVPLQPKRQFGAYKGIITIGAEFFEPLSEEELEAWGS